MGGRGTAGKTKLFTNIDADRNRPFREARAKELEAERAKVASGPKHVSVERNSGLVRSSLHGNGIVGSIQARAGEYEARVARDYSLSVPWDRQTARFPTQREALAHFDALAPTLKPN
jgi:hypothetical protein